MASVLRTFCGTCSGTGFSFKTEQGDFPNHRKRVFYNEEIRHELMPYFAENIGSRLVQVIRAFQERGELADRPAEAMARHIFFQSAAHLF